MKNSNSHPQTKQFSYLGSTAHYPKVLSFTIDYVWLTIRPDFGSKTLKDCVQKLRITARKQLNEIELDMAELVYTKLLLLVLIFLWPILMCYIRTTN
jgi:hypothetical protein